VFEPFYRLDEGIAGTGLGLSISREIVELHGGAITLHSELGQGSCFEVCLAQA
jgi:signal transduction histidine kinase